jgi:hypothetical protein
MTTIPDRIKAELLQALPPTVFFFIAFQLLVFTKALALRKYGIEFYAFAGATVMALLVGKVVLVVDKIPLVNRYPHKPLIYNAGWKTLIYFAVSFLVRYLEHVVPLVMEHGSLGVAHQHLLDKVVWPHLAVVQLWLLVLLFLYSVGRELVRAVGREEVLRIFFAPPAARSA